MRQCCVPAHREIYRFDLAVFRFATQRMQQAMLMTETTPTTMAIGIKAPNER
jgi:hypothetical protein